MNQLTECNISNIPSILLVEDEPIVQRIHRLILELISCQVDIASNGKEAIKKANNHYDLIFMDVGLSDIDGIQVTKIIRQYELEKKHTPIIMLTAYTGEDIKEKCLAAGANEVFNKPISTEKFKEIICKYCIGH